MFLISKRVFRRLGYGFSSIAQRRPLIETTELLPLLKTMESNLKIVNTSFILPPGTGDVQEIYNKERLPKARFFGLDEVCDKTVNLPHMLPSLEQFESAMKRLDIANNDTVVFYDDFGIVGACRGWYTFKYFGMENIYILNGGFQKWKSENLPLETTPPKNQFHHSKADFFFKYKIANRKEVSDLKRVQEASFLAKNNKGVFEIIDARGEGRFQGKEKEPRPGVRSGCIPGSKNLPFKKLLNENWTFKSKEEIQKIYDDLKVDPKKTIINSCGSGMTASVLFVAEDLLGFPKTSLYDGSWSEYGTKPDYNDKEIETGLNTPVSQKFMPNHVKLEKGKEYFWCSCGRSLNQPFCDGNHIGTSFKPMKFTADQTKSYNLCRCKYSKNKPFCDLSHIGQAFGYAKKSIFG